MSPECHSGCDRPPGDAILGSFDSNEELKAFKRRHFIVADVRIEVEIGLINCDGLMSPAKQNPIPISQLKFENATHRPCPGLCRPLAAYNWQLDRISKTVDFNATTEIQFPEQS